MSLGKGKEQGTESDKRQTKLTQEYKGYTEIQAKYTRTLDTLETKNKPRRHKHKPINMKHETYLWGQKAQGTLEIGTSNLKE